MLNELKVTSFAVIDNVHIEFKDGFNVLSGETGAGKSILIKSLELLMGAKGSSEIVRSGAEFAMVEGSFDITQRSDILQKLFELALPTEEKSLIVRRVISGQGKSRVYINNSLCPLQSLQEIVAPLIELAGASTPLIELTGQHENKNLTSKSYHLFILDRYANTLNERKNFSKKIETLNSLKAQIDSLVENERQRAQRLDFLEYQRDEIKCFQLRENEGGELEKEYHRVKNAHLIRQWADHCESTLYSDDESALVRIHKIIQKSQEIQPFDEILNRLIEQLKQAKTLVEDFVYSSRAYHENLDFEPDKLETLEKRRSDLRGILKKYGPSEENVFRTLQKIEAELLSLQNSTEIIAQLQSQCHLLTSELETLAKDLHKKREKAAKLLAVEVNDELNDLNMKGVIFEISVQLAGEIHSTGQSEVEFLISNPKERARPLAKSASGGELSRILLSLKSVIGQSDLPRTCLFDEVDAGVSGPTAEMVGRKLANISKDQQIICVTHLPQVAAHASNHYLISKKKTKSGFQTEVIRLSKDERVREIARLISGETITSTSLAHAKQLLTARDLG